MNTWELMMFQVNDGAGWHSGHCQQNVRNWRERFCLSKSIDRSKVQPELHGLQCCTRYSFNGPAVYTAKASYPLQSETALVGVRSSDNPK